MLTNEEWEVFYSEYSNASEKERKKILDHYASYFIPSFVDKLEAYCNEPDLIYAAIGARHALTINGLEIYGNEFDAMWKESEIGQAMPSEDQLKTISKNTLESNEKFQKYNVYENNKFNIYLDNRLNSVKREDFHIESNANFPDFIKGISVLDQITNELIQEAGIRKQYDRVKDGTISQAGESAITAFQQHIQKNLAKLALEKMGTKFSMDTSSTNSINSAVLPAVKKYQNSLDYFEKHINNPNRFFVTMFEFDQYLAKDENRQFLSKNKKEKHRARDINTMFIAKLANALTYSASADQAQPKNTISTHSNQEKDFVIKSILDCRDEGQKKILAERWIYVADYLVKQGNFLSAQSIMNAFSDKKIASLYNINDNKSNFSEDASKVLSNLQSLFAPDEKSVNKLENMIKKHKGIKMGSDVKEASIISNFIHHNEDIEKRKISEIDNLLAANLSESEARYREKKLNTQQKNSLNNEVKELNKKLKELEDKVKDLQKDPTENVEKLAQSNNDISNLKNEIENKNNLIKECSKRINDLFVQEETKEEKKHELMDQKEISRRAISHYQELSDKKSKSTNENTLTSGIKFKYLTKPSAAILQKIQGSFSKMIDPLRPQAPQKSKPKVVIGDRTPKNSNTAGIFGKLIPGKEVEILKQVKLPPLPKIPSTRPMSTNSSIQETKKEFTTALEDNKKNEEEMSLPPLPRSHRRI